LPVPLAVPTTVSHDADEVADHPHVPPVEIATDPDAASDPADTPFGDSVMSQVPA
jgi:hypothetical protein